MFCKWCGNTIKTTDKKCSSCGRETPPLSDCGGFYDLKRPWEGAPLPPDSTPAYTHTAHAGPDPEVMHLRAENQRICKEANDRHRLMLIICGGLALALIVVLILYIVAATGDKPAAQPPLQQPVATGAVVNTPDPSGTSDPTGTSAPSDPAGETIPPETEPETYDIELFTGMEGLSATVTGGTNCTAISTPTEEGLDVELSWEKKESNEPTAEPALGQPEDDGNTAEDTNTEDAENMAADPADKIKVQIKWDQKFENPVSVVCDITGMSQLPGGTCTYTWYWGEDEYQRHEIETTETTDLSLEMVKTLVQEDAAIALSCEVTVYDETGTAQMRINVRGFQISLDSNFLGMEAYTVTVPEKQENATDDITMN